MADNQLILLSIPGLRSSDVDAMRTPTLFRWASRGLLTELTPTFPCVTSCVQATMWTGVPPDQHGVIANGLFDRVTRQAAFWVAHHDVIEGKPVWDAIREGSPGHRSAVWHGQNIKGASADYIVTPAPIHESDGTTKLWCFSRPDGLYQRLLGDLGHFPLHHYWGPMSNIESTRWILRGASWLMNREAPGFQWIYIPHLDYALQKFGPDSEQAKNALAELDQELAVFAEGVANSPNGQHTTFLSVGEYAMTNVDGAVHPNRILREAELLAVREENGAELLDLAKSSAFSMVDHQFAHVYVFDPNQNKSERARAIRRVAELFRDVVGVVGVYEGSERARIGMTHDRCGDVVLVSDESYWFAYYWWMDDRNAPGFARTVDIHRKPGYDPVELFFDPATKGIPVDASLVKGSHGVPATSARHRTAFICSRPVREAGLKRPLRDTDVKAICLHLLSDSQS